jgi:hypothetical protein
MSKWGARLLPWVLCMAAAPSLAAGIEVPAGAVLDLGGGSIDLANGDMILAGGFSLGSGNLTLVRAFRVIAGGSANLGSGLVRLTGDWENRGTVVPGTSRVEFRDGATGESLILGNTDFANLSLVSATGKRYRLESGSLQTIAAALSIQGQPGTPIQLDVTLAGNIARLALAMGGTQSIVDVGVSDVHAVEQPLAPAQSNQGGRGNAAGWFGGQGAINVAPLPIPGPSLPMLAVLAAAMLLGLRRRDTASHAQLRA